MQLLTDIHEAKTAKTAHPIHELLAERWSPRAFSDKTISKEQIKVLLEAARWAASSSNEQPWRFIYTFRGTRSYKKIFGCLSDFNQKWVGNAPVLLLTAYKEQFDSGKENFHALHDLGLAVGNLTLQATSMGIALHQMAGVDWEKAQQVFEVPEGYHVATAIALGYYTDDLSDLSDDLEETETATRTRKPIKEFAWDGSWGEQ